MVQCYVPQCKNRSDSQNWKKRPKIPNVSFHSFPKNDTTRNLWIDILGLDQTSIPSSARICSVHFKEESFDRTNPRLIRLRPNAFPFIEEKHIIEQKPFVACSQPSIKADKATMILPSTEDKATMVSPKRIYDSPENCRFRQRIEYLKVEHAKKVRNLQQNLRRRNDQIATLKNALNLLKEKQLLTETQTF